MERKVKATAAAVIATMLLLLAPLVMTDAVYASSIIKSNTISEEGNQGKNIQNKTDTKEPVVNKLLALMSSSGYNIKTNLKSGFTMRSSKKIFDVWARNGGTKITASATLFRVGTDGSLKKVEEINIAWDDGNKASFILDMSNQASGNFRIKIWAGGSSLETARKIIERDFEYNQVPVGGYIGDITIDIEAFTLSLGYIEEPTQFPVYEGENAAQVLDRYLKENGYTYTNTGSLTSSFYLGSIDGIKTDLSKAELESTVATKINEDNYGWNKNDYNDGSLGEFDFTGYSGWMYSVNNVFPNVGFSEFYLDAGDVMRVQFTVALGREIGGSGSTGGWNPDFYAVADKSESTEILADINSALNSRAIKEDNTAARLIEQVKNANQRIGATQDEVDDACDRLNAYLDKSGVSPNISLNASEMLLRKGNAQKLEVDYDEIQSLKPLHLEWTSDEDLIATVDSDGNVTGHRAGTTTISAHLGESIASCQVTIEEVPLKKIKLVPVTLWSGGEDPYEQYKTEDGYRLPTDIHPEFMIEPVPEDTTDDITPKYSTDTKKYMDILVLQDSLNRCSASGKHSGTTVLTAQVGNYSDQLEIEFYENKVQDFTLDSSEFVKDGEIVLNINGEDDLKNALLYFTPDPIPAQDYNSCTFASSDPNVFTVSSYTSYSNSVSMRIYPHNDGVAELYVTIGNITKTYPVTVNDMEEIDEIVAYGYSTLSQTYSASQTETQTDWIGGIRYRSGKEYKGTKDAKQFRISLTDPATVLSFQGETYTAHDFICSGTFQDIYAITSIWPLPTLTGSTGTATFINKMFGNERMITKVTVVDEVIPVETVELKADGHVLGDIGQYNKGQTIDLDCKVTPANSTGEIVWYSSDLSVATVDQEGHVEIVGSGCADIVACKSGVYCVHKVAVEQPMTGMTISNPTLDLTTGMSRQLKAWCVPNDTTDDRTITWESSDPEVVSVSDNGKVEALSETQGETVKITARAGTFSKTCEVTVDDHKLRQIYFPKSPIYIEVGETVNLGKPSTIPENVVEDVGDYHWSSSDDSYASVDQEGNVTLHKASPSDKTGVTLTDEEYNHKVKIFAEKDGVKGTCIIETGSPLTGLDISSKEVTIYKGEEIELEALFSPDDTTIDRRGITWTSSNELAVSQRPSLHGAAYKRLIVGLKTGEVYITAHCDEFTATCKVKVVLPEDQQAAYDLQKKIESWCELDPIADRADYVGMGLEIQETWETFTDAQKKLVGGYNAYFAEHADEINKMAGDDSAVDNVKKLISAIGKISYNDGCKERIDAARKAYDALTADQRNLINDDVFDVLTSAEEKYSKLKEEAEKIEKQKTVARNRKVNVLKVKSKSRKFTLSWKKTKGASGYQVQYRKKGVKKFTYLKKAVVKAKVKSKKLKKGKKYQFRVRTYTIVEGSKVYGKWTKVKTAKCK